MVRRSRRGERVRRRRGRRLRRPRAPRRAAADLLQAFETGSRYEIAHALALVLTSFALERSRAEAHRVAGWLFLVGQVLFSGSLYALALSGTRLWGVVTPLGGICLMAGWLSLGIGLARSGRTGNS